MISEAIKIAGRSPQHRFQTGCVIVRGNEVLSNGWSHIGMYRPKELWSLHAELHALARSRHIDIKGARAYVATLSRKSGNTTCSRPCLRCAIALRSAGVLDVIYTERKGLTAMFLEDELRGLKVYGERY